MPTTAILLRFEVMDSAWKIDRPAITGNQIFKPSSKTHAQSPSMPAWQTGLYIHIPFCERKCPYCDFNTYAGLESLYDDTVDALCQELRLWGNALQAREIRTVFLGGGTPSALSLGQLEAIFNTLQQNYHLSKDCEITSEVNPGAVDREKFAGLKALGVSRLSMGVQSFQECELKFLGRIHDVQDVYKAYDSARGAGFDNINLDFIFGLPQQQDSTWRDSLRQAIALSPDHLSLYSLIVEPNTVLNHWVQTGQSSAPDEDEAARHYESAMELMAEAGYAHYEVSNWARTPDLACQHNLIYWRNDDYLGVGPGAHSHLRVDSASETIAHSLSDLNDAQGIPEARQMNPQLSHMLQEVLVQQILDSEADEKSHVDASAHSRAGSADSVHTELRWGNRKPVPGYIKRINAAEPTGEFTENPSLETAMGETMMLGLRLIEEGVPFARFKALHGADLRQSYADEIEMLTGQKLIQLDEERIRLTDSGLMVGNQVFHQFLA